MVTTEHPYVVCYDDILRGEPVILNTRTPIRAIVEMWRNGIDPTEIPVHLPHLSIAAVFDALSYYNDHQAEINGYIEANHIPDSLRNTRLT